MIRVPRPTDDCQSTFNACVAQVQDVVLRRRLQSINATIVQADQTYVALSNNSTLHAFPQTQNVDGVVTKDEMVGLYDRLLRGTARGIYDRLISRAPYGKCPICAVGTAATLDHHLPKDRYLTLAVNPNNLVPACDYCQRCKLNRFPGAAGEQTMHPYFDNFDDAVWLTASVEQCAPVAFTYSMNRPVVWSDERFQRVQGHMKMFGLTTLYSLNAAEELSNIRVSLSMIHESGGLPKVKEHMAREAVSRASKNPNSWLSAMYKAGSESDWFCDTGFALE